MLVAGTGERLRMEMVSPGSGEDSESVSASEALALCLTILMRIVELGKRVLPRSRPEIQGSVSRSRFRPLESREIGILMGSYENRQANALKAK